MASNRHSRAGGNLVSTLTTDNLITDHIDVWTSAIKKRNSQGRGSSKKIELTGIKKLREFILDLAVRGKLVPQNSNDESASILLKKMAKEKAQLIADKKIKKQKPLPPITDADIPLGLPSSWECSRMGKLAQYQKGYAFKSKDYLDNGLMITKIQNLTDNHTRNSVYITPEKKMEFEPFILREGDIVMTTVGSWFSAPMSAVGRSFLINNQFDNSLLNQNAVRIRTQEGIIPKYLYLCVNSTIFKSYLVEEAQGTANQASITQVSIKNYLICIPPLAEQHRIVAKVDELMALCDQLEQQTEQGLTAQQTLVEALLKALTQCVNADDFQASWQRIADHFDVLFTTEASIEQLKQTILQLAVMGKLVPQNPFDEPASKLLEKIAEEKAQLLADKKIKKQKPLPAITDEGKLFELPSGWSLTRLDDICFGITSGSTPPKDKFNESTGVPYLKVYNIKDQAIAFDYKPQFVDIQHHKNKLTRSILYPGDVVMNIVGPPLGKIAIIPDDYPEWNCNQAIVFFRPIEGRLNGYIYTYLTSGKFLDSIELIGTAGQDNISVTKSRSIIFPMPPLAEQHRIVAKVDELMALCEQLKTRLSDAQTTQLHLADAVVENALKNS
ncbi:restriction endonuclease subunit S [Colwellia ponticola]|uniref:Restriction endonuclease subunit S n=1 Tax=Colwellia ponticola TaxID=2304625 RepID=A0A8H2JPB5_9GAMM|nr:restriction endonuclease subunit S [Colwellia ponticola]TMM46088.1 restriction endonuclease subunit S [Colwellia ponticola]